LRALRAPVITGATAARHVVPAKEDNVQRITSNAHLDSLRESPPATTQTWLVDDSATDVPPLQPSASMREMTQDETEELAAFLELEAAELDGPFYVAKDMRCPNCERELTFLDFVQTAVESGAHDKALVGQVLTGRAGRWITVVGEDGGRDVTCVACGHVVPRRQRLPGRPGGDCDYEGQHYRYG
jgi:hypothetical protein